MAKAKIHTSYTYAKSDLVEHEGSCSSRVTRAIHFNLFQDKLLEPTQDMMELCTKCVQYVKDTESSEAKRKAEKAAVRTTRTLERMLGIEYIEHDFLYQFILTSVREARVKHPNIKSSLWITHPVQHKAILMIDKKVYEKGNVTFKRLTIDANGKQPEVITADLSDTISCIDIVNECLSEWDIQTVIEIGRSKYTVSHTTIKDVTSNG